MLSFRRALIVVGLSAAALYVSSAGGLAAGNPGRTPLPTPPDVTGNFCGDAMGAVTASVAVNQEYIKTYTNQSGTLRFEINGRLVVTVTGNGKTLTFNASGPATLTFNSNGTVFLIDVSQGRSFVIEPFGLFVYSGLINVDPATGLVTSSSGHVTDVCALLG